MTPFSHVNGARVATARVVVGARGPWVAEVTLEGGEEFSGLVTLTLGTLVLKGTVDASDSGTLGGVTSLRIVGGAGAWGNTLTPKGYHNDLGVKASLVAQDAAREVGETIAGFVPSAEKLGKDYVRQALPASRALEDAAGTAEWWVGYDGVTVVGTRPASAPAATAYEVMAYEPNGRRVTLAVDSPDAVQVGAVLSKNLPAPLTVRELEITSSADELRVVAWCGEGEGALARAMRSIVERLTDGPLFGLYRYRVVRLVEPRVELQAVRKAPGLPDLLPVSYWPGVAGAHAAPALGAEVLVQFLEGDRAQPVVTHFAGKDGAGFVPTTQTLDAGRINLGAGAVAHVALAEGKVDAELAAVSAVITTLCGALGITPVPWTFPGVPARSTGAAKIYGQ